MIPGADHQALSRACLWAAGLLLQRAASTVNHGVATATTGDEHVMDHIADRARSNSEPTGFKLCASTATSAGIQELWTGRSRRGTANGRGLSTAAGASMGEPHQAHGVPHDESAGGVGGVAAFAAAAVGGGHTEQWRVDVVAVDVFRLGRTGSARHAGQAAVAVVCRTPSRCWTSDR